MADNLNYTVDTQYPTVEFLGGTQTRDVVAVGITTQGHGVYMEFRIPQTLYSAKQVKAYATGYTGSIESQFDIQGVAGLQWSQQPNASGELQDVWTYTVTSSTGNSAATFTLPIGQATTDNVTKKVNALASQLNQAEALTS